MSLIYFVICSVLLLLGGKNIYDNKMQLGFSLISLALVLIFAFLFLSRQRIAKAKKNSKKLLRLLFEEEEIHLHRGLYLITPSFPSGTYTFTGYSNSAALILYEPNGQETVCPLSPEESSGIQVTFSKGDQFEIFGNVTVAFSPYHRMQHN